MLKGSNFSPAVSSTKPMRLQPLRETKGEEEFCQPLGIAAQ
jgi:hypothetical protein